MAFCAIIWSLWLMRNEIIFQGKSLDVNRVIDLSKLRWAKWGKTRSGIGGVLRDHLGKERIRFSKSIGVEDSNEAELMAIREAFILFATSRWVQSCSLIIESDSTNAVNWILKPKEAPWRLRKFINYIENLKALIRDWSVVIPRESNQVADETCKGRSGSQS
ncbi:hypothetical protein DITRI_Ditri08aG0023100 [Diplodiscus trichospermus]